MKRLLIIAFALALVGCGKQAQAETTPTTEATITDQASKEIEVLDELEANGQVVYNEVSGDIIDIKDKDQDDKMMDVIRQDVVDGVLKGEAIDEEVDMWCDFLSEAQKDEFKRELHLLESPASEAVSESQKSKTENKETQQPTKSQPKETAQVTAVTEPVVQPTQPVINEPEIVEPENSGGGIDTSGWDLGGGSVTVETEVSDQSLSPEEYKAINEIQFN